MAGYSDKGDLEKIAGSAQGLIELTAAAGATEADDEAINRAIRAADEWIDSYVGESEKVPLDPVPLQIRETSAQEAYYRLRKARRMVTPDDRDDHQERLDWLNDIARGRASLPPATKGEPSDQQSSRVGSRSSDSGSQTREDLKGIW